MKKRHSLILASLLIVTVAAAAFYTLMPRKNNIPVSKAKPMVARVTPTVPAIATVADPPKTTAKKLNTYRTVLEELDSINNDKSLGLLKKFPDSYVTNGSLDAKLTKTKDGYIIKLPNSTPVTSPSFVGDTLYASGGFSSRSYSAFIASTGVQLWCANLGDDGPSTAVFDGSEMIFNTESCTMFAINRHTGKMMWSHWLGDPLLSSPVVSEGKVYTSYPAMALVGNKAVHDKYKKITPTHPFICLDAKTGATIWQKWLDGDVLVSPVINEQFVYLATFPGTVYKLDKRTGQVLAAASVRATSTPSISKNYVYITRRADKGDTVKESIVMLGKNDLKLVKEINVVNAPYLDYCIQQETELKKKAAALDSANGFIAGAPEASGWKLASKNIGQSNVSSLQMFQPSTVMFYGDNIVSLMGKTIYCLNAATGQKVWTYNIDGDMEKQGGSIATTPIICNNYLVTVTTGTGRVVILDMNTGKLAYFKSLRKAVRTAPVARAGVLYVPTSDGEVVAINTGLKGIDGWSMFMKNPQHNM